MGKNVDEHMGTSNELFDFDPAEYLDTDESQAMLVEDAFSTGNKAYILNALNIVARARGMSAIAKEAGMGRQALYNALSESGNPTLENMLAIVKALDLKLGVHPAIGEGRQAA